MATATSFSFSKQLGATIRQLGLKKRSGSWYDRQMAAAARAIKERVPLVDLVVEVRDARIPATSAFALLQQTAYEHKHIIVLNKVDLADRTLTESWVKHLGEHKCYRVNSHNTQHIKELLKVICARMKELKASEGSYTGTILLTGIPNVGKSAIANSMHQISRIDAEERGKLKHAVVSPYPGETKDIRGYKIANVSHPNIYVFDTPGVLPPKIADDGYGSKLALTGVISDSLLDVCELARYFLAVVNSAEEYKQWGNLQDPVCDASALGSKEKHLVSSGSVPKRRQYSSDHTQDFIVRDVRGALFKTISSFNGHLEKENDLQRLIDAQFTALYESFRVSLEPGEFGNIAVAAKVLNLYRTGRLGHYTLDLPP